MTRLADIRARVERSVGEKWNIDPDIPFLLDLVERAEPWVKAATLLRGFRVEDAEQWLLDVREEEVTP